MVGAYHPGYLELNLKAAVFQGAFLPEATMASETHQKWKQKMVWSHLFVVS